MRSIAKKYRVSITYEKVSDWLKENIPYVKFDSSLWLSYMRNRSRAKKLPKPPFDMPWRPQETFASSGWVSWEAFNGFTPTNDRTKEFVGGRGISLSAQFREPKEKVKKEKKPKPEIRKYIRKQSITSTPSQRKELLKFAGEATSFFTNKPIRKTDIDFQLFKQGDPQHFELIFRSLYRKLFYFCKDILGDRAVEIEDILSDMFVMVWKKRDMFESMFHLEGYIHRAIQFRAFTKKKVEGRRSEIIGNIVDLLPEQDEDYFDNLKIEAEALQAIYDAIERLPTECKRIFKMHYLEEKGYVQIGNELGISTQTVRNQKTRAVMLIRSHITSSPRREELAFSHFLKKVS